MGALSNIGGRSGGRGPRNREEIGAGTTKNRFLFFLWLHRSFGCAFALVFAASPLSSAPDKTAMLRRLLHG